MHVIFHFSFLGADRSYPHICYRTPCSTVVPSPKGSVTKRIYRPCGMRPPFTPVKTSHPYRNSECPPSAFDFFRFPAHITFNQEGSRGKGDPEDSGESPAAAPALVPRPQNSHRIPGHGFGPSLLSPEKGGGRLRRWKSRRLQD